MIFTDPKLIAINAVYLRSTAIETIGELVKPELEAEGLWQADYAGSRREWYLNTLDMIRDRFHTLKDFATLGRAYFDDTYPIAEKPLRKHLLSHPELKTWLPALAERFAALDDFTTATTEAATRTLADELDVKAGILINAMRTVLTGQLAGPGMFDVLETLGKATVVRRLRRIAPLFPQ